MNFVYDPKIAAQIARVRELRPAGQGREGGAREDRTRSSRATRSIFPSDEMLAQVRTSSTRRRSNNQTYIEQWQKVLGA